MIPNEIRFALIGLVALIGMPQVWLMPSWAGLGLYGAVVFAAAVAPEIFKWLSQKCMQISDSGDPIQTLGIRVRRPRKHTAPLAKQPPTPSPPIIDEED